MGGEAGEAAAVWRASAFRFPAPAGCLRFGARCGGTRGVFFRTQGGQTHPSTPWGDSGDQLLGGEFWDPNCFRRFLCREQRKTPPLAGHPLGPTPPPGSRNLKKISGRDTTRPGWGLRRQCQGAARMALMALGRATNCRRSVSRRAPPPSWLTRPKQRLPADEERGGPDHTIVYRPPGEGSLPLSKKNPNKSLFKNQSPRPAPPPGRSLWSLGRKRPKIKRF